MIMISYDAEDCPEEEFITKGGVEIQQWQPLKAGGWNSELQYQMFEIQFWWSCLEQHQSLSGWQTPFHWWWNYTINFRKSKVQYICQDWNSL